MIFCSSCALVLAQSQLGLAPPLFVWRISEQWISNTWYLVTTSLIYSWFQMDLTQQCLKPLTFFSASDVWPIFSVEHALVQRDWRVFLFQFNGLRIKKLSTINRKSNETDAARRVKRLQRWPQIDWGELTEISRITAFRKRGEERIWRDCGKGEGGRRRDIVRNEGTEKQRGDHKSR